MVATGSLLNSASNVFSQLLHEFCDCLGEQSGAPLNTEEGLRLDEVQELSVVAASLKTLGRIFKLLL